MVLIINKPFQNKNILYKVGFRNRYISIDERNDLENVRIQRVKYSHMIG